MNPAYDFTNQVALVTGAASGIGLAAVTAFAEAGAAVMLADVNEQAISAATADLAAAGHRTIGMACDVTDEAQVAALVDRAVSTFGRLDVAFNNAGVLGYTGELADEPIETYDQVAAVNLRGVWTCMKYELLQMRAQGSGAIVNTSSLGGLVGLPNRATYHAAKHGVIGLTKSAAMEYAARGIPVVASDCEAYRGFVEHGVTGFLVRYEHEWDRYLRDLVNDEAMREQMGAAAKRLAAQHTIQARYGAWQAAYEGVMDRVPVP